MIKTVPLFHGNTFEFRAEAYNFINHSNLAAPDFTATDANVGKVTSKTTSNPRTLQVGARYNF